MKFGIVTGTVVPSEKAIGYSNGRFLLVEVTNPAGEPSGEVLAALDLLGANRGERVLVAQGSSCRQGPGLQDTPVDAVIAGIIDIVEVRSKEVYHSNQQNT